jgi:hypothetical protein
MSAETTNQRAKPTDRKEGKLLYGVAWQTWNEKGEITASDIAYLHAEDAPTARANFFACNAARARTITSGRGKIVAVAPVLGMWEDEQGISV